jgi:hypothetical protein
MVSCTKTHPVSPDLEIKSCSYMRAAAALYLAKAEKYHPTPNNCGYDFNIQSRGLLLEEIKRFLSLFQDKENDPDIKDRYLTEALRGLHKMSLTIG